TTQPRAGLEPAACPSWQYSTIARTPLRSSPKQASNDQRWYLPGTVRDSVTMARSGEAKLFAASPVTGAEWRAFGHSGCPVERAPDARPGAVPRRCVGKPESSG